MDYFIALYPVFWLSFKFYFLVQKNTFLHYLFFFLFNFLILPSTFGKIKVPQQICPKATSTKKTAIFSSFDLDFNSRKLNWTIFQLFLLSFQYSKVEMNTWQCVRVCSSWLWSAPIEALIWSLCCRSFIFFINGSFVRSHLQMSIIQNWFHKRFIACK